MNTSLITTKKPLNYKTQSPNLTTNLFKAASFYQLKKYYHQVRIQNKSRVNMIVFVTTKGKAIFMQKRVHPRPRKSKYNNNRGNQLVKRRN